MGSACHYRSRRGIFKAVLSPSYQLAALRTLTRFRNPLDVLGRYAGITRTGYPRELTVSTPIGPHSFTVRSIDDLVTAIEVFSRLDYRVGTDIRTVVDFGSNIGVSALYFLTRNASVRAHLFEADPRNVSDLKDNLAGLASRFDVQEVAVGDRDGTATFGFFSSGRYGGVDIPSTQTIQVRMADVNRLLEPIVAAEGGVDVLKVDIEGMEAAVLNRLRPDVLAHIRLIFAEMIHAGPDLPGFRQRRRGGINVYDRLE